MGSGFSCLEVLSEAEFRGEQLKYSEIEIIWNFSKVNFNLHFCRLTVNF